jgi:PhoPQ-activated pathogenicity-related protein
MLTALLATAAMMPQPPRELYDYLAKRDPSYAYTVEEKVPGRKEIALTSQTWQGIPWKHTILLQQPAKSTVKGTAILYITGDGPRPGDMVDLSLISGATSMPIAMLFDTPNQPLWDMKEDDLIAHTFEKYLETGDSSWPLLFPMTKGALRAMDAVQAATKNTDNPIKRFVVAGASKRGWTTWFVGASNDRRVIGIAPMVYDNLNVTAQMRHQIANWGKYSEQIEEYTRRGLQAKLETPAGQKLGRMVDPFSYRANIRVPTLIVNGANDPYWSADSTSLYWNELRQPHWLLTVPNAGHGLGSKVQAIESVGSFARALAGDFKMPKATSRLDLDTASRQLTVTIDSEGAPFKYATVWAAPSETLDFRLAKYSPIGRLDIDPATGLFIQNAGKGSSMLKVPLPKDQNAGVFVEYRYDINGRQFSLCSPTKVFRK